MSNIDLSKVPEEMWIDLCVMAIRGTAKAMATPEGREAVEKGKQEYLRHMEERKEEETKTRGGKHERRNKEDDGCAGRCSDPFQRTESDH